MLPTTSGNEIEKREIKVTNKQYIMWQELYTKTYSYFVYLFFILFFVGFLLGVFLVFSLVRLRCVFASFKGRGALNLCVRVRA